VDRCAGDGGNAGKIAAFRQQYQIDASVRLVGGYDGTLDGRGELLQLVRADLRIGSDENAWVLHDETVFDDQPPWPQLADGQPRSLVRRAPNALGPVAASWASEPPSPGVADLALSGDLDFDRDIDFDDIAGMVLALTDMDGYQDRYGVSASIGADVDRDGTVNNEDRDLFLGLLGRR